MIKHGGLISSSGDNGWYTTVEENEVIEFEYPINSLLVETSDTGLSIQINGTKDNVKDENLWILDSNSKEGIEGLTMRRILIQGEVGQKLRWKGLIA